MRVKAFETLSKEDYESMIGTPSAAVGATENIIDALTHRSFLQSLEIGENLIIEHHA